MNSTGENQYFFFLRLIIINRGKNYGIQTTNKQ